MLDLYEQLTTLVAALDAEGAQYALCGGLAMAVWGRPRATVDIDLLVPPEHVEGVVRAARRCGFDLDAAPMTFAGGAVRIRRVTKVDPESSDVLPLDLLIVTPAIEEVWKRRELVAWEAGRLWVVSRAGLVALKQLRASGQDRDDIEELTRG